MTGRNITVRLHPLQPEEVVEQCLEGYKEGKRRAVVLHLS